MFASKITRDVPLSSDPSITVTIRKLSWLQRKEARNASLRESQRELAGMGREVVAFFQQQEAEAASRRQSAGKSAPATVPDAPDPLALYDLRTVLLHGVKAWSVPEPVSPEAIDDLSPEDAEQLARAILTLSLPSPTLEADRKNDG